MANVQTFAINTPPVELAGTNATGTIVNLGPGRLWVGTSSVRSGQGFVMFPNDELEFSNTLQTIWGASFILAQTQFYLPARYPEAIVIAQVVFS